MGGGPTATADRSSATEAPDVGADMGAAEMGADTGAEAVATSTAAATAGGGGATGDTTEDGGATGATGGATGAGMRGGAPHTDVPITLDSAAGGTSEVGPTGPGGTVQAPASAVAADATASSDDCWYISLSVRRAASPPLPIAPPSWAVRGGGTTAAAANGDTPIAPADPCRAPGASDGATTPIGGGGAPPPTAASGTGGATAFGGGGRWCLDDWAAAAAAAAAAADRGGTWRSGGAAALAYDKPEAATEA